MSTVINIPSNTIPEVVIGTQTWAPRNYDFNGTYPDSDIANREEYGCLYTADEAVAIGDGYPGWHLPTLSEYTTLATYLGGWNQSGKLKESGTTHWNSPNTGATNSSGFTALGAGHWFANYTDFGNSACFWTSTKSAGNDIALELNYDSTGISLRQQSNNDGFRCSVRLIKD